MIEPEKINNPTHLGQLIISARAVNANGLEALMQSPDPAFLNI
jgi:hypothetical protein